MLKLSANEQIRLTLRHPKVATVAIPSLVETENHIVYKGSDFRLPCFITAKCIVYHRAACTDL